MREGERNKPQLDTHFSSAPSAANGSEGLRWEVREELSQLTPEGLQKLVTMLHYRGTSLDRAREAFRRVAAQDLWKMRGKYYRAITLTTVHPYLTCGNPARGLLYPSAEG